MKITIVQGAFLPVPSLRGGAIEKAWFELGKAFAKEGHEVTHISRHCDNLPKKEFINGVCHIRVRSRNAVPNAYLLKLLELPYVWRVRRILPKADILITNAFWAPILFDPKKNGKVYVHVGRYPKGQLKLYRKAFRLQAPSSAIALAIEEEVPNWKKRISTIPYPLPWKIDDSVTPFKKRKKRVLFLGRIHPEKGIIELIRAWHKLTNEQKNDWELRIVGPWRFEQGGGGADFVDKVKQEIKKEDSKIKLCEPIFDQTKIKSEYEAARLFVYPSLAEKGETFGLSVLEAMSMGCIPMVTSLACFNDFISSKFGYICQAQRSNFDNELAETLKKFFSLEQEHETQSKACIQKAKEFSLEKVANQFLDDFKLP